MPVTHVLNDMGITDITIVPEQEYPNGYFPTCSYPNPEIFEALKLGLELATKTGADLMLATDPDADRVGIAMKLSLIHICLCFVSQVYSEQAAITAFISPCQGP